MTYLTMTDAKLASGTTRNPIIKAIKGGDIHASKNDLGHWKIDRTSFRDWLASRTKNAAARPLEPSSTFVNLARDQMKRKLMAKEEKLSALEREHWTYFRSAPSGSRQDVLNAIFGIRQQRDLLQEFIA